MDNWQQTKYLQGQKTSKNISPGLEPEKVENHYVIAPKSAATFSKKHFTGTWTRKGWEPLHYSTKISSNIFKKHFTGTWTRKDWAPLRYSTKINNIFVVVGGNSILQLTSFKPQSDKIIVVRRKNQIIFLTPKLFLSIIRETKMVITERKRNFFSALLNFFYSVMANTSTIVDVDVALDIDISLLSLIISIVKSACVA